MKVPIETCNKVSVIWINKKLDVRLLETSMVVKTHPQSISGETNRKQGSMFYSARLLSVPSLSPSELHFPLHSASVEVDWWSPTLSPLDQAPPSALPAVMPSPSLPANKMTHATVCSLPYVSVNMKSAALLIRQNPAFTSILICNTKDFFYAWQMVMHWFRWRRLVIEQALQVLMWISTSLALIHVVMMEVKEGTCTL